MNSSRRPHGFSRSRATCTRRADQSVAHVIARRQRHIRIRSVMRVDVHRKVKFLALCRRNRVPSRRRSDTVRGCPSRRWTPVCLLAGKTVSNAAHVNGNNLSHTLRNRSGSAVSDFLKDGDMLVDLRAPV